MILPQNKVWICKLVALQIRQVREMRCIRHVWESFNEAFFCNISCELSSSQCGSTPVWRARRPAGLRELPFPSHYHSLITFLPLPLPVQFGLCCCMLLLRVSLWEWLSANPSANPSPRLAPNRGGGMHIAGKYLSPCCVFRLHHYKHVLKICVSNVGGGAHVLYDHQHMLYIV